MIRGFLDHLAQFRDDEGGNATIEFALFVPFFFVFFVSAFEMGMLMIRQTMLDRGVDLTVRMVRLNQVVDGATGEQAVTQENLRRAICFFSGGLVPRCDENLRIEMIRADPHNWAATVGRATAGGNCVNVEEPAVNDAVFDAVSQNELIIIRVCALIQPFFLDAGLGSQMVRRSGDNYAVFSMGAFVVEPDV